MIKDFIRDSMMGFKLAKYGLKVKMQIGMALLFFTLGVVIDVMSRGASYLGGFYIVLAGMFVFQCIISMDASTLIQSSGYKRKIQVSYPYYAVIPLVLLFYTILAVAHGIMAGMPMDGLTAAENYDRQILYFFSMNTLLFAMLVYFGLCYKYFILGMIVLMAAVFPLSMGFYKYEALIISTFSLSGVIIMGYILIIVGFAISILISKALYRKEMSRLAVRVNR